MKTRKLVSVLLVIVLLFSNAMPVYAIDSPEQYGNLPVEYTNGKGTFTLPVMVKERNLYVDGIKLADCLGYKSEVSSEKGIVIFNTEMSKNLPLGYTQFLIDSREVINGTGRRQKIFYEAPCPTVSNANGYWIPLDYALTILRAEGVMIEGTLMITLPQKSVFDLISESQMHKEQYDFDWFDDFGYDNFTMIAKSLNSQFINFSNGLLQCGGDSTSWKTLFQYLTVSEMDAYDKKYANELAVLFCTYAEEELKQIAKTVEDVNNVFSSDGKFGSLVKKLSKVEDNTVGEAYKQLERAKTSLEQGNPCTLTYNKAYQYLEKTLDSQRTFEKTAGTFLEVQEKVKDATTVYTIGDSAVTIFDVLGGAANIVGYGSEFKNADEYSITALNSFIKRNSEEDIESMMSEMDEYLNLIQGDILTYGAYRYIYENWDNFIKKACKLSEGLGTQANIILAVWSIASSYVPFVKDGLDAADNFELASYSEILEKYSYLNYLEMWEQEMSDIDAINHEKIYKVGQAYYTYLKFCYITREAALSSLNMESRTKHFKEEVQPLINQQTDVNKEIAEVLAELKATDKDEKTYRLGFLPADSEIFNRDHSDEAWISALTLVPQSTHSSDVTEFNGHAYQIYHDTLTWNEAKIACESRGGYLATITSQEEQQFIEQLNQADEKLWIGGFKGTDGYWNWVTGEPWNFAYWDEGEPNNSSNVAANEAFTAIWPQKWNDLADENVYEQSGYICEWGEYAPSPSDEDTSENTENSFAFLPTMPALISSAYAPQKPTQEIQTETSYSPKEYEKKILGTWYYEGSSLEAFTLLDGGVCSFPYSRLHDGHWSIRNNDQLTISDYGESEKCTILQLDSEKLVIGAPGKDRELSDVTLTYWRTPRSRPSSQESSRGVDYAEAYVDVLNGIKDRACYEDTASGKLFDMNNDGVPELAAIYVVAQGENNEPWIVCSLYTAQNGQAVQLFNEEKLYLEVGGQQGSAAFAELGGQTYFLTSTTDSYWEDTIRCWGNQKRYTLEGSELKCVADIHYDYEQSDDGAILADTFEATLNGNSISQEEMENLNHEVKDAQSFNIYSETSLDDLVSELSQ